MTETQHFKFNSTDLTIGQGNVGGTAALHSFEVSPRDGIAADETVGDARTIRFERGGEARIRLDSAGTIIEVSGNNVRMNIINDHHLVIGGTYLPGDPQG